MKAIDTMNLIASDKTLDSTSKKMTEESKSTEFQSLLAGFKQQEQVETDPTIEESLELPEVGDLEENQLLVENENTEVIETPEELEDLEELDPQESEQIEVLDPSHVPTSSTIEQQAIASFFNPMPLRSTSGGDVTMTSPIVETGEEQVSSIEPTSGEGTLMKSELTTQTFGADSLMSSNPVSETETIITSTNIEERETATKMTVETTIVSQSSIEGLSKTSEAIETSAVTPTVIEIPSSLLPRETTQTLLATTEKALTQVAQKLEQPLVQKITTMNQGSTQKLTVELLPERLGKVEVTIQVTNNKVQLEFVVQNSQTRQLLETVKPRLEQIMHKQEFQEVMQGKVTETASVASSDLNQSSLSDQSNFQQSFQQERRQQTFGQQINKGKTFSEIAAEKQTTIEKGSIDILA
ncbi:flagellar hook-length control protein FliK [Enterococcus sp.]|uniref:flagellar hook-length control protein FliK n=1 Tax=Enterococcus sp. TaxID=35783 RepID=UPI002FC872EA